MAREVRCGVTDCLQTDTHDNTVTVTAHACRRLIIGWQYWEFHKPTQTLLKLDFTKIVPFQKNGPNHTITIEFGALRRIKYKVGSRDTSLIHQCAHVIYIYNLDCRWKRQVDLWGTTNLCLEKRARARTFYRRIWETIFRTGLGAILMVPVFHHFPGIYKYLCSVFSAIQCISSFVGWGGGVKITRLNQHIHCPLYISVPYIFHDTVSLHPFISSVIADNARSRAMKLVHVKEINTKFGKVHHECY